MECISDIEQRKITVYNDCTTNFGEYANAFTHCYVSVIH